MRPETLNPLFAEAEVLKGVGPQVAKLLKRLDLTRVVDVLTICLPGPSNASRLPAASAGLLGHNVILELTPHQTRENRSGRGPMRVFASDQEGNSISLIYFNNPSWAKRSLPMGEKRIFRASSKHMATSGRSSIRKLRSRGRDRARPPGAGLSVDRRTDEPAHGRTRRESLERLPTCPSGSNPVSPRANAGAAGVRPLRSFIVSPALGKRGAARLRRDICEPACAMLLRQSQRRHRTIPLPGTGELSPS